MSLKLFAILASLSLSFMGCRTKEGSNPESVSKSEADDVRVLTTRLNTLTSAESKAIDDSRLADVIKNFSDSVAASAAKSNDPRWKELQRQLEKSRTTFAALQKRYATLSDLRQAAGLKDYKHLDKINPAPWQSDLDAFPTDILFPAASAGLNLSDDVGPLRRAAYCTAAVTLGAMGLILKALPKNAPEDRSIQEEVFEYQKTFVVYGAKAAGKVCAGLADPDAPV